MNAQIVGPLDANREWLARQFGLPDNVGIMLHELSVGESPPSPALLLWVDGLSSDETRNRHVLEALASYGGSARREAVRRALSVPVLRVTRSLVDVAKSVLVGATVLLVDGWAEALVLDTVPSFALQPGMTDPHSVSDPFTRALRANITLVRTRLRDPGLRAVPIASSHGVTGKAALLYLEGRASAELVTQVARWAAEHAGEEVAGRGLLVGAAAIVGFMPRLLVTPRPDKAAILIESGYVALLVDRVPYGYVAPVTVPAWMLSPNDFGLPYPVFQWVLRLRVLLYGLVLFAPGAMVALLNYHPELLPTSFLLAVASARENAPFGVLFEVLALEALFDLSRVAALQLPGLLSPGNALLAALLVTLVTVLTGLTGPVLATGASVAALATLALPSYEGAYLDRSWRILLFIGAVLMGFFGMAAVFVCMLTFLCQARSWGVPVLGPSGIFFSSGEGSSSRKPGVAVQRSAGGGGNQWSN